MSLFRVSWHCLIDIISLPASLKESFNNVKEAASANIMAKYISRKKSVSGPSRPPPSPVSVLEIAAPYPLEGRGKTELTDSSFNVEIAAPVAFVEILLDHYKLRRGKPQP